MFGCCGVTVSAHQLSSSNTDLVIRIGPISNKEVPRTDFCNKEYRGRSRNVEKRSYNCARTFSR